MQSQALKQLTEVTEPEISPVSRLFICLYRDQWRLINIKHARSNMRNTLALLVLINC